MVQSVHVRSEAGLKERSIRQLSGGERRRVALALALGFADLIAGRGQIRCNLIVLDEASASAHPVNSSLNYNDCCFPESVMQNEFAHSYCHVREGMHADRHLHTDNLLVLQ